MPTRMTKDFKELEMPNSEKFKRKRISGVSIATDIETSCLGKEEYLTFDDAKNVISKMNKRKRKGNLVVYQCRFGHKFHIGNQKEMK